MKFENPIMNISMFEMENVITASGVESTDIEAANSYVDNILSSQEGQDAVKITITF